MPGRPSSILSRSDMMSDAGVLVSSPAMCLAVASASTCCWARMPLVIVTPESSAFSTRTSNQELMEREMKTEETK